MLERKEETKIVKETLSKLGYQNIKVTHGRGTAWGWLTVEVSVLKPASCDCDMSNPHRYPYYCNACKDILHTNRMKITDVLLETTGRHKGDYDGNTIVDVNLVETTETITEPPQQVTESIPYSTRETRRHLRMVKADRANTRITKRNGVPLYY